MLVVAAALIDETGRVLVQRRPIAKPYGGLWEFPGGKVEPDETPAAALVRELHEELGIAASPAALVPVGFASEPPLLLLLYALREWGGMPVATAGAALRWRCIAELADLAMPPADRPLVTALARYL